METAIAIAKEKKKTISTKNKLRGKFKIKSKLIYW